MRVIAIALVLAACGESATTSSSGGRVVEVASFPAMPSRDLDLLIVEDDSPNSYGYHVGDAFQTLLDELTIANGGLVNLHILLVTSDMGTSSSQATQDPAPTIGQVGNGGCTDRGKDGLFQKSGTTFDGPFLVDEEDGMGGRRRNYTGDLAAMLEQMMRIGNGGCGFEQHLHAMQRALDNPANGAFRRSTANLAILISADEDDCSVHDTAFFTNTALGPLDSFRCTSQGVTCNEDIASTGAKTGCRARDDSQYIDGIAPYVALLDELQPDRSRVVVAAVVGPRSPVETELVTPPGGTDAIAHLKNVCSYVTGPATTEQLAPGVRFGSLVDAFASHGILTPACSADQTAQLTDIGRTMKQLFGIACLDTSQLADARGDVKGVQPSCEVADVDHGIVTAIPSCPFTDHGACYEIVADAACEETSDHLRVRIRRDLPVSATTHVEVRCETP